MNKKILIIEDEAALQKTLGKRITDEGYNVVSATDGETGIKIASEEKPDLIILDLILPKKNGFEVLEKIKSIDEIKQIPVIVLTNLEGIKDIQKVLDLGATTYLIKADYSLDEVVNKIKFELQKQE